MGYSVRALENRVKNLNEEKKPRQKEKKDKSLSTDLQHAEDALREKLGTRVKIQGNEQKGKITIEYFSAEDLERVYDVIGR